MKTLLLSFILASVGVLTQASANEVSQFVGHYEGELRSGDQTIPVSTVFSRSRTGSLTGSYTMTEEEGDVTGRLTFSSQEAPNLLLFSWKDKYGEGFVRFLFSSDGTTFAGYWGESVEDANEPWSGQRE